MNNLTIDEIRNNVLELSELDKITEQAYIEMSKDFRNRMIEKNKIINDLQKKIIILYALIERHMDTGEEGFLEEARMLLDKSLIDNIGIQDLE